MFVRSRYSIQAFSVPTRLLCKLAYLAVVSSRNLMQYL